jgi:shikimate 5-dehydrogenase
MLVAQAVPQFEEWHAREAPVAAMERAARRAAAAA